MKRNWIYILLSCFYIFYYLYYKYFFYYRYLYYSQISVFGTLSVSITQSMNILQSSSKCVNLYKTQLYTLYRIYYEEINYANFCVLHNIS